MCWKWIGRREERNRDEDWNVKERSNSRVKKGKESEGEERSKYDG